MRREGDVAAARDERVVEEQVLAAAQLDRERARAAVGEEERRAGGRRRLLAPAREAAGRREVAVVQGRGRDAQLVEGARQGALPPPVAADAEVVGIARRQRSEARARGLALQAPVRVVAQRAGRRVVHERVMAPVGEGRAVGRERDAFSRGPVHEREARGRRIEHEPRHARVVAPRTAADLEDRALARRLRVGAQPELDREVAPPEVQPAGGRVGRRRAAQVRLAVDQRGGEGRARPGEGWKRAPRRHGRCVETDAHALVRIEPDRVGRERLGRHDLERAPEAARHQPAAAPEVQEVALGPRVGEHRAGGNALLLVEQPQRDGLRARRAAAAGHERHDQRQDRRQAHDRNRDRGPSHRAAEPIP